MTQPTTLKTFLWFDGNLADALEFYAATFTDFKLHSSGRPELCSLKSVKVAA
jgi:predicted 3-demethylubiquinone-9 3-methyltransferase (glyoxalase superfamily)